MCFFYKEWDSFYDFFCDGLPSVLNLSFYYICGSLEFVDPFFLTILSRNRDTSVYPKSVPLSELSKSVHIIRLILRI